MGEMVSGAAREFFANTVSGYYVKLVELLSGTIVHNSKNYIHGLNGHFFIYFKI